MAVRPCPTSIICPGDEDPLAGDSPVSNYSSEGPEDQPVFLSLIFPREWNAPGCASLCTSTESQQAADECALAQNAQCPPATDTGGDPGGTPGTPRHSATTAHSSTWAGSEPFSRAIPYQVPFRAADVQRDLCRWKPVHLYVARGAVLWTHSSAG